MMHIEKQTHKIKEKNRYKTKTNKTQIVVGCSLRKNNYHINRLKHKEYGETKKWNTYSISRNGEIFEHYDPQYYSDFLGIKDVDKQSISIILENMGSLVKLPDGGYINWLNESCDEKFVAVKNWMGQHNWETFTDEQYNAIIQLSEKLCDDFNITKKVIEFHHYHKDTIKFTGIVLRSNYIEDSTDINPLFNLVKFDELLKLHID